jgi:tetratricopeptide (TPR) repeat protein
MGEDTILAFLAGQLEGEELGHVEGHLDSCSSCRRVVVVAAAHSRSSESSGSPPRSGFPPARRSAPQLIDSAALPIAGDTDSAELLASLRSVDDEDYLVQRELARGGMGRILLALDRQGRRVALKVLLGSNEDATQRFLREMQITARLQHPSIVTLYEAGRWRSGEPFFAMKLVEGRSLRDELAELPSLKQRLSLVPRLIAVTDALAYAHDRGVIHRDLKPGNILVGAFGETVVIDWGLAKVRGAPEVDIIEPMAMASPPLVGAFATELGTMLGTPAYMAPEQARGEAVDERVDVYGLGALLYHALAGQPPYSGATAQELLGRVIGGPPRALEELVSGVPPELGAIVRRAMLPNPADRYPSAKEMAEDLRRFSTGQLVSAHAYSSGALVRRWLRRNRAPVAVALGLLAVGAVAATLSVQRIVRERNRAEVQEQVATTHSAAAEHLVEFLIVEMQSRARKAQRLDLMEGVGEEVAKYYDEVNTSGVPVGTRAMHGRASALETLGTVELERKNWEKSRRLFAASRDLWQRAAEREPLDPADVVRAASVWRGIGTLELQQGNLDAALEAYRQVVALADECAGKERAPIDCALLAADALERMSEALHVGKGDIAGALEASNLAISRVRALAALQPDEPKVLRRLASLHTTLALRHIGLGRPEEASTNVSRGIELYSEVVRLEPGDTVAALELARAFAYLGAVEAGRRQLTAAMAAVSTSIQRYEAISATDPQNRAVQQELGSWGYANACSLERSALRLLAAEGSCRKGVDIFRAHVQNQPSGRASQDFLLHALVELGRVQAAQQRLTASSDSLSEALGIARKLVAADSAQYRWKFDALRSLAWLSDTELKLGRVEQATAHYQEASSTLRELTSQSVGDVDLQTLFAKVSVLRGDVASARHQQAEARVAYEGASQQISEISERWPSLGDFRVLLAEASAKLSAALAQLPGEADAAATWRERAHAMLDGLANAGQLFPEDERLLSSLRQAGVPAREPGAR